MLRTKIISILIITLPLVAGLAANVETTIKVGVVPAPPYAMKNAQGGWEGISIELWQATAAMLGVKYEYQETDYAGLFKDLAAGRLDVGIGKLCALEMHEAGIDFTHSCFFSGLAIAVPKLTEKQHWLKVWRMLLESNFFLVAVLILVTLALSGITIWLIERHRNPGHFPEDTVRGIWSGIWWSASTITTIGYGDKVPVTFWGRLLALFWMTIGIILVSVFTATIASMSTVSRLNTPTGEFQDLDRKRVAVVTGSPAEVFMQKAAVEYEKAATTPEVLKMLVNGRADMAVDDQAALKYYCRKQKLCGIYVMPTLLTMKGYSFALTKNNPLREALNQAIKEYTLTPDWQNIVLKYLGN